MVRTWRQSWYGFGDTLGGHDRASLNINLEPVICREMGDWLGGGDSRSLDDAVRGVCSTQCML
jgi:hypothetical protein